MWNRSGPENIGITVQRRPDRARPVQSEIGFDSLIVPSVSTGSSDLTTQGVSAAIADLTGPTASSLVPCPQGFNETEAYTACRGWVP